MTLPVAELEELARQVGAVLSSAEPTFIHGMGAVAAVTKGPRDYATAIDLELERFIGDTLARTTGFGVSGEELGGADIHASEPVWLIDPIDGTANFMHHSPLSGMNCALVVGGIPVIGATWLPVLNQRYLAVAGGSARCNDTVLRQREPAKLEQVIVGVGNLRTESDFFPERFRHALLAKLLDRAFRVRLLGSCALDLAWVASGQFGASVQFSVHPWDLAPGICMTSAVGASSRTLDGRVFTLREPSVVCAAPGVCDELVELVSSLGDPSDYAD
ncbi:MAG: inositol monophosphatase [Acidimicrobiales bacterium]|nr:MAG: inositol monophosphatase [Acidimicrobiales bacterium]